MYMFCSTFFLLRIQIYIITPRAVRDLARHPFILACQRERSLPLPNTRSRLETGLTSSCSSLVDTSPRPTHIIRSPSYVPALILSFLTTRLHPPPIPMLAIASSGHRTLLPRSVPVVIAADQHTVSSLAILPRPPLLNFHPSCFVGFLTHATCIRAYVLRL